MDAITILEKYKQLTIKEYEIQTELNELKSIISDERLLGKYNIRLHNYSFDVYHIDEEGKVVLLSLDDLKEIEELTGSRLSSMGNYTYHFTWVDEISDGVIKHG